MLYYINRKTSAMKSNAAKKKQEQQKKLQAIPVDIVVPALVDQKSESDNHSIEEKEIFLTKSPR